MSCILRSVPRRRGAWIALFLLPGAALTAILPGTVRALGGPRPVTVSVEGEVRRPGSYTLPHDATLSTLIVAAGGYSDNADLAAATLTRDSAREAQSGELQNIGRRLREARAERPGGWDAWRGFLDELGALPPLGRVPAPLSHPRLLKGSPRDLPLEEGDVLRIPAKRDTVAIRGAVREPGRVVPFAGKTGTDEYVRRAGGYADTADRGQAHLMRPNGAVVPLRRGLLAWNAEASRWEIPALVGGGPAVGPGDTIIVPRKPVPGSRAASVRNLQELLMRVAEITGVIPEIP
jgi:protein involved in polysaccharide export with SLBB domain